MATLDLWIEGIEPALSVRRFDVREGISEPFSLSIVACSPRPDLDLDDAIFRPASFAISAGWAHVHHGGSRLFTGLCNTIEQVQAEPSGLSTYSLRVVPRLWLLTLRQNYRIFQHVTVPEIAACLLDELSIAHSWRIDANAFPRLDYKVQYGEHDLAFLSRLFEEVGLTYFIEDSEQTGSLVVVSDAPCSSKPRGASLQFMDNPSQAAEREFATRVRLFREGRAGAVAVRDYDFRHPSLSLFAQASRPDTAASRLEQYHYEPGAFRVETTAPTSTPVADRYGTARHDPHYGQGKAERMLQGEHVGAHGITFETNALDLAPGVVFSMSGHPHPRLDESRRLLATHLSLEGEHDKEWTARGKAVLADHPYHPPRKTSRPRALGFQSAIVTGPKGREIYTDEYGRVRVQFPWDREGDQSERSSCWIRVSQGWSGAGFGMVTIPRVGQEVLVGFLEGDPDQPIILGRAPNAHNPPPYPLPANETKTVWRSQSSPGSDGFNEISFEDLKGEELLYQRAQRNRESHILNEEKLVVGGDRKTLVQRDQHDVVSGERRELVAGTLHIIVKGERREHVEGSQSSIVDGDRNDETAGGHAIHAGRAIHISSDIAIVIQAPDITLSGAGAFVRVANGAVTLDGGDVLIKKGGAPGVGAGCNPAEPEPPTVPAAWLPPMPAKFRPSPMLGILPVIPANIGPDVEMLVICEAICECDKVKDVTTGRRKSQDCVTHKLWAYDIMLNRQSTIKAEVPYNMATDPPTPYMSKNHPGPTTGRPGGSKIPDVVIVKDPSRPPTQDNIKKVIEIKFGKDDVELEEREAYLAIAGGAPFEVWRPGAPCQCKKEEPDPEKVRVEDLALAALLLLAAGLILADDLVPGGAADDPALVPVLTKLIEVMGRLRSAFPVPGSP